MAYEYKWFWIEPTPDNVKELEPNIEDGWRILTACPVGGMSVLYFFLLEREVDKTELEQFLGRQFIGHRPQESEATAQLKAEVGVPVSKRGLKKNAE